MLFIKWRTLTTLLAMSIMLSACQTTDTPESGDITASNETAQGTEAAQQTAVVAPLTAGQKMFNSDNRYLNTKQVVPVQAKAQFEIALAAVNAKDTQRAILLLNKMTTTFPTLSGTWLTLGDIAREGEDYGSATKYYLQAIAVNADNYFARNRLAGIYRQQGLFSQAKEQYSQAIASWPGFVSGHKNLAILLDLYLGDKRAALVQYKLAKELAQLHGKEPDRQLKGWIADVSRQVAQMIKREKQAKGQDNG